VPPPMGNGKTLLELSPIPAAWAAARFVKFGDVPAKPAPARALSAGPGPSDTMIVAPAGTAAASTPLMTSTASAVALPSPLIPSPLSAS
jgi:hypothetical protein